MAKPKSLLFDYLKDINTGTGDNIFQKPVSEMTQRFKKEYNSYMVNTLLAGAPDCIMSVCRINKLTKMSAERQYVYLRGAVPKKFRFVKFPKKFKDKELEMISHFFECSLKKAKEYRAVLTPAQLEEMTKLYKDTKI